jgi:CBS domain-containing protein
MTVLAKLWKEFGMQARDIMTPDPVCCQPDTNLQEVAQLMIAHDCGSIPVVSDMENRKLIGIITDRDITSRAVAEGLNPQNVMAANCMTTSLVVGRAEEPVGDIAAKMENAQVRRIPIVDEEGCVCGIIAQADLARDTPRKLTGEVVREISTPAPTGTASRV